MIISSDSLLGTYAKFMSYVMTDVEYYENDECITITVQSFGKGPCLILRGIKEKYVFICHHASGDDVVICKTTADRVKTHHIKDLDLLLFYPKEREPREYHDELTRTVFNSVIKFLTEE